ncbi:hypothetical protein phiOC_p204 [Ochrobactrum phage vB_OspM_OC]|nr:hypothetical protein phiOC_p204 [Ochrobactrum phage vB_OspM_OC]
MSFNDFSYILGIVLNAIIAIVSYANGFEFLGFIFFILMIITWVCWFFEKGTIFRKDDTEK